MSNQAIHARANDFWLLTRYETARTLWYMNSLGAVRGWASIRRHPPLGDDQLGGYRNVFDFAQQTEPCCTDILGRASLHAAETQIVQTSSQRHLDVAFSRP